VNRNINEEIGKKRGERYEIYKDNKEIKI